MRQEVGTGGRAAADLRAVADAIPHIVWLADDRGEVVHFNRRGLDYTGRSQAELLGWGWLDLVHPDDAATTRRLWERALRARRCAGGRAARRGWSTGTCGW